VLGQIRRFYPDPILEAPSMRYLTRDEVLHLADWPAPAFDKAASTYLPKKLRVKLGTTIEYAPATVAFLRLVALLRGTFGDSRIPATLAEQALPQLERALAADREPGDHLAIQARVGTVIDIRSSFLSEIRASLKSL
jgi:hypothetical protein